MRLLLIAVLVLLDSCAENAEIKNSDYIGDAYMRTTEAYAQDEQSPSIDIISPKDGEVIKDSKIVVVLDVRNFRLVAPDKEPKHGQGHVQVWVDNMEFRSSKTRFVFENESNGIHTIKAELMLSNNTVLPYSKSIRVFVDRPQ